MNTKIVVDTISCHGIILSEQALLSVFHARFEFSNKTLI